MHRIILPIITFFSGNPAPTRSSEPLCANTDKQAVIQLIDKHHKDWQPTKKQIKNNPSAKL